MSSGTLDPAAPVGGAQKAPPWRLVEIRIIVLVMLINIVDGLDYQLLPLTIVPIARDWGIAPAAFAGPVSAGFLGAVFGTPLGGWLGDLKGRKATILVGVLLFGAATMAMGLANDISHLVVLRLISGLGVGMGLPPIMALTAESVPPERRGTAIAAIMLAMPLGLTLSGLAVPRLLAATDWPGAFFACGGVTVAVALLSLLGLPASPPPAQSQAPDMPGMPSPASFVELFRRLSWRLVIAYALAICLTYLAMTLAMSWLPAIAELHGYTGIEAGQAIALWSLTGMLGTMLAGLAVNRLGGLKASRIVLALYALACGVGSAILAVGAAGATPLYVAATMAGLAASGAITVLYAASTSIFPSEIRASGMSIITLSGKSGGVIGGALGALVLAMHGLSDLFLAVGGLALVGWMILLALPPKEPDRLQG